MVIADDIHAVVRAVLASDAFDEPHDDRPHDGPHEYEDAMRPSLIAGDWHRPCKIPGCRAITLDPLHDIDTLPDDDGYLAICSCGEYADGPTWEAAEAALACAPDPLTLTTTLEGTP